MSFWCIFCITHGFILRNMMMKHLYLIVFLMVGVLLVCMGQPSKMFEDCRKQITMRILSGNANGLSEYFRDMVELALNQSAETYSKTQAASILGDFFQKNPPTQFEEVEAWKDEDVAHVIGNYLSTNNTVFRFHYIMKKNDKGKKPNYLIYSINIEQTKKCRDCPTPSGN